MAHIPFASVDGIGVCPLWLRLHFGMRLEDASHILCLVGSRRRPVSISTSLVGEFLSNHYALFPLRPETLFQVAYILLNKGADIIQSEKNKASFTVSS